MKNNKKKIVKQELKPTQVMKIKPNTILKPIQKRIKKKTPKQYLNKKLCLFSSKNLFDFDYKEE